MLLSRLLALLHRNWRYFQNITVVKLKLWYYHAKNASSIQKREHFVRKTTSLPIFTTTYSNLAVSFFSFASGNLTFFMPQSPQCLFCLFFFILPRWKTDNLFTSLAQHYLLLSSLRTRWISCVIIEKCLRTAEKTGSLHRWMVLRETEK